MFQDASGVRNLTNAARNSSEYVSTAVSTPATEVLLKFEETSGSYTNNGIGAQTGQTLTIPPNNQSTNAKFGSRSFSVSQATNRSVKLVNTSSPYLIPANADFTLEFFKIIMVYQLTKNILLIGKLTNSRVVVQI